jgi:hypothetical protein
MSSILSHPSLLLVILILLFLFGLAVVVALGYVLHRLREYEDAADRNIGIEDYDRTHECRGYDWDDHD